MKMIKYPLMLSWEMLCNEADARKELSRAKFIKRYREDERIFGYYIKRNYN